MENERLIDWSDSLKPVERNYFDFEQYVHRLFTEHQQQSPSFDSCSESDCTDSVIGSSDTCAEYTELSDDRTGTPLRRIKRKGIEKARKAHWVAQLRRWLLPKNAVAALHELRAPFNTEMVVYPWGQNMRAEIVINNVKYEAIEQNKHLAKEKASEQAMRDLIVKQLSTPNTCAPPDILPMEHLAPFAVYKLLTEWQVPGFKASGREVPGFKASDLEVTGFKANDREAPFLSSEQRVNPYLPKVTKHTLPPKASSYHPGVLFSYMRPQVPYEYHINEDSTDQKFMAGLRTDGCCFIGMGRSKKVARKEAAVQACSKLFGVVFDDHPNIVMEG